MSTLKRRIVDREDGCREWALYGRHGVISWELIKHPAGETYNAIEVHAPRPQWPEMKPVDDCPFLEGACYRDTWFFAGDNLGRAWAIAARNDAVIWRQLEDWYRLHLDGGEQA